MNLRDFLSWREQRQLEVVEALYQHPSGITSAELLKLSRASEKTIRTIIGELQLRFPAFKIVSHRQHYYWQAPSNLGLDRFYDYLMQETSEMKLLEHLLFEDCFTYSDCANTLFLSNAGFHRLRKKFQNLLAPYGVKICNRPFRIEGNEIFIRSLYTLYFCEKRHGAAYLLPDSQSDNALSALVTAILKENQLPENYRVHEELYFSGAVAIWRQNTGHKLPMQTEKSDFLKAERKMTQDALLQLKETLLQMNWRFDFTETFWSVAYDYLLLSFEHFKQAKLKNPRINQLAKKTEHFLNELLNTTKQSVTQTQKDNLIWYFCNENYIYLKDCDFIAILSNSRREFVLNYEKKNPSIIAGLKRFIEDYKQKHQFIVTTDQIYQQLFLIITLLPQVLAYWQIRTKTLILSDVSLTHPQYLHQVLRQHFPTETQFEIIQTITSEQDAVHEQLEAYDLIISTFSPQEMFAHLPVVTIKATPDFHDFLKIETALRNVTNKKMKTPPPV